MTGGLNQETAGKITVGDIEKFTADATTRDNVSLPVRAVAHQSESVLGLRTNVEFLARREIA